MTRMRISVIACFSVITGALSGLGVSAAQAQPASSMKQISVDNGHVVFSVPSDFQLLTAPQIAALFPNETPPKIVYANPSRSVSAVVKFLDKAPSLSGVKETMDGLLPQSMPGFHWVKESYVVINHTTWLDMEFTSHGLKPDYHNEVLVALRSTDTVCFNLTATIKAYPKSVPELRAIKNSLKIIP